jgi:hypothetical protein
MASSKRNEAIYAAVESDFPEEEDFPMRKRLKCSQLVHAPCDLAEGLWMNVMIHGKQTVVTVVHLNVITWS